MLIANARVAFSATQSVKTDIVIRDETRNKNQAPRIDLEGHLLLPGLINAHDHLEFNLFPRLGRRIYANATEWAADIYRPHESPVREHLAIPKRDRLLWGAFKNLLSGVTTVVHHNPYHECFKRNFPVRVPQRFGWAHSLAFSPDIAVRYRRTPPDQPFLIHAGEGTDAAARAEFSQLDRLGVLRGHTILIHALAFDLDKIRNPVIWCPSSNLLTYGRTLEPLSRRRIALGTDSAISAAGDMIDELRAAHNCGASLESLYSMVTGQPVAILNLRTNSDLIAIPDRGQTPAEALLDLSPELVIVRGRMQLVSKRLAPRVPTNGFHPIVLEGRGEWLTPFDVPALLRSAQSALGPEIRLAGKRVST